MPTTRKEAPPKGPRASRSGPNIPEAQRHTVAIKLRLPPAAAALLDKLAAERDATRAAVVEMALLTLTLVLEPPVVTSRQRFDMFEQLANDPSDGANDS